MPIILHDQNLAVFTAPKAGSTSIKQHCHTLLYGEPFALQRRPDGTTRHVHHQYPNGRFRGVNHDKIAGFDRFALLRDPVERVLSCHSNRVMYHKALTERRLSVAAIAAGAVPDPDVGTFIDLLDIYIAHSPTIAHHMRPLVVLFGDQPSYYTRLFRFAEIEALAAEIATRFGRTLPLDHHQTGGQRVARGTLRAHQIDQIKTMFAADYASYGRWLA